MPDDNVSSLDADILFIVSAPIRKVISDTYDNRGNTKQVLMLTYYIHFHDGGAAALAQAIQPAAA